MSQGTSGATSPNQIGGPQFGAPPLGGLTNPFSASGLGGFLNPYNGAPGATSGQPPGASAPSASPFGLPGPQAQVGPGPIGASQSAPSGPLGGLQSNPWQDFGTAGSMSSHGPGAVENGAGGGLMPPNGGTVGPSMADILRGPQPRPGGVGIGSPRQPPSPFATSPWLPKR